MYVHVCVYAHIRSFGQTHQQCMKTHCINPYLSVQLYRERSGSSHVGISAPSSRPLSYLATRTTRSAGEVESPELRSVSCL